MGPYEVALVHDIVDPVYHPGLKDISFKGAKTTL